MNRQLDKYPMEDCDCYLEVGKGFHHKAYPNSLANNMYKLDEYPAIEWVYQQCWNKPDSAVSTANILKLYLNTISKE